MKVAILTTSYPRHPGDAAGRFLAEAVEHVRASGVEVDVVSPARFRHYGIAYGAGVVGNLRRRPQRALALPLLLREFRRAARAAAHGADLVHAHWLPAGAIALGLGRPVVVTVHGTDLELARRMPRLARAVLSRARLVVAVSTALADSARALGARDVRVIPDGVVIPDEVGDEATPPEVLFAGRLSREKGILELVAAVNGYPLVVAGDGPLRAAVPQALGFVSGTELERLYRRAAVVACPSHREGFGVVCAEAMAHGRPVVASAVGGLLDLVVHEETGLLVPPRDVSALRAAIERLLPDRGLRSELGAAARERARERFAWPGVTELTLAAYREALS